MAVVLNSLCFKFAFDKFETIRKQVTIDKTEIKEYHYVILYDNWAFILQHGGCSEIKEQSSCFQKLYHYQFTNFLAIFS